MPLILGTNSIKDTGFNVAQSAMLYSNAHYAGSYSSGNTRTFTYSFWTKRTHPGLGSNHNYFISHYQDANNRLSLLFDRSTEKLTIYAESGGSSLMTLITDRAFRDFSAWYHIVLAFDTTQGTASNRVKVYINGVQETSFSTETYPNEDVEIPLNTNIYIGTYNTSNNFLLTGVQVEIGEVATEFEHVSFEDDLVRCLRYCWVQGKDQTYTNFAEGTITSSTGWEGIVHMPVPMRTKPTTTFAGTTRVWDAGSATNTSATGTDSGSGGKDVVRMTATCSGASFNTGRSALFGASNDATASVTHSAEL